MTIGFDASRAFGEGRTGTENYSFQLLKNLIQIDTENRYLIYTNGNQLSAFRRQLLEEDKQWPGNFEFRVINMPRLWTQIGLAFRTWIDPLDVLFVPSHTLPLLKRPGLKTVITVHDLGAEYLPGFHQVKQVLYLKLMTHYQIKTASKIIAVSEATKKDLVSKIGIKADKVEVIHEGVDKSIYNKVDKDIVNDVVKKYDLVRGKYFLCVGTIQPRKNLERVIRAFSEFLKWEMRSGNSEVGNFESLKLDNQKIKESKKSISQLTPHTSKIQLVLVGNKGWKSEVIYELPKELGVEDSVRFLGRISDQEVVGLYNGALGLVYPSLFEGFGLPILEAFACGCPVITSDTSSMPEVAGNAAILVDPLSEEEITQAMKKLASDDIFRLSLINKGILRLGRFTWEAAAKKTLNIFSGLK